MGSTQSKTSNKRGRSTAKSLSELPLEEKRILKKLQNAVSPDLLKDDYRWNWPDDEHYEQHLHGHCYVVVEAFYHLFGKKAGYQPYCYKKSTVIVTGG